MRLQLRVEIHHASVAVLEIFDSAFGDLSADEKLAVFIVNVIPSQAECFVSACSAIGHELDVIHKLLRVFGNWHVSALFILLRFKSRFAKRAQISRSEQRTFLRAGLE